jgi:two-component system, sporulation sensor kinase E
MQEEQHSERQLNFLGRLAGVLSHELRNPLNAIFLHLDIIDEELRQLTPGDRTQVDLSLVTVKTEVVRLHELMQDYLVLTRLSDFQRTPEDVSMLLEAVARKAQDQLAAHGIPLHQEGFDDLGEVSIHKSILQRALLNLVQQAATAMPQGGRLTLRSWRTPSHVHLAVHHTGDSLQPNTILQEFSASQAAALAEENFALYVVYAIVTAHGGVLEASSASGQGTTVTVTLPSA